ncbi:MAG: hypothetical protein HPY66_0833 [Firmicutes bacterium]|nr:hypothetical protein [Bacillota bacterium]
MAFEASISGASKFHFPLKSTICAICGFHYGDAPSASSYYDFIKRLWKTPHKIHVARTKKLRPFKAKPRKKLKAGQKDVQKLSVAGDGTPFYSGASHYGTKVCDCKEHGIYDCQCPRRYSDPDARWGWDSYREQWFYRNNLFNITASDSPFMNSCIIGISYPSSP